MAGLSDSLLFASIVVYALAMLGFAGSNASRRSRTVTVASPRERALVGAGAPAVPPPPTTADEQSRGFAGTVALGLTVLGWTLHLGSVVTRGIAADRLPWGNMYEFSCTAALVAVTCFLVLVARGRVDRTLGAFVMLPVVLYLGLAGTVLYTAVGPLVPALNSYWIKIHVAAAVTASGAFLLSGVLALLYLIRERFDTRTDVGQRVRFPVSLGRSLPSARSLDRTTYVVIAFAFPVWTFAVIAGAIWAEAAWGRYWGWDPKETWSFITWVLYAGYLHARATAGWKGRKSAWVAVAAAAALIIDYYVVNIFVVGLHSYA
ncbi:MAG: c-type cytochrome biogenesis protein CcsB [Mycobacteriales bacterium]